MMHKLYILFLVFSCTFYSTKGSLPAHINSIYINSIQNESSEPSITNQLLDNITKSLINENVIDIKNQSIADSRLDIIILDVKDVPNIYGLDIENEFTKAEEWKITITCEVSWLDLVENITLFSNNIQSSGIYGSDSDINLDGIDNDGDNLIDGNDSDEFGPPREGAIRIAIEKLSRNIINQITSTW